MPQLKIPTRLGCWVVPEHFAVVKAMIMQQQLQAADLQFGSNKERQCFVRRLALLALADECQNRSPSVIAELTRDLIKQSVSA